MPVPITSLPFFFDGDYGTAVRISRTPKEYPFSKNGDITTAVYDALYVQDLGKFTPTVSGTVDPENAGFFLVTESKPVLRDSLGAGHLCTFVRKYSNIPLDQVTYDSRAINKPTIPNDWADTLSLRTVTSQTVEVATGVRNSTGFFTSDGKCYAPFNSSLVSIDVAGSTGGTFTLTYKTSTTAALNDNSVNATINGALNGLPDVITDGLTFSAANNLRGVAAGDPTSASLGLTLTAGATATLVTMDATNLTFASAAYSAAKHTFPFAVGGGQRIKLGRPMTLVGHNFTAGVPFIVVTNQVGANAANTLVFDSTQWAVYDADHLAFFETYLATAAVIDYSAPFRRNYTPGAVTVPCRITLKSYLPGSGGGQPATPADIPIVSPNISDADVIAAVLAVGTWKPVDFSGPKPWMDSAFYQTTETDINFSSI